MVALVTGHRGFLGRRVVAQLEAAGLVVIGAGRPEVEIPSGAFDRVLDETLPDLVVHCAGPASVPASVEDPAADRQGSVEVTSELVASLLRRSDPPRLLLVSSAAVYGEPARLPIAETVAPAPISPYGRHRLEVEELVRGGSLPSAIVRIFSAYGEGLRRQLLWDIAQQADAGPVELWGTGEESRDFVHVDDVAGAIAVVCEASSFGGEVVNVASGVETTVATVARMLLRELGVEDAPHFTGVARTGDPERWQADVTRLAALGFEPKVTLEEGIARYAHWIRTSA